MKNEILKVAICDDEEVICGEMEQMVLDYGKSHNQLVSCEVLLSGEDLVRYLETENSEIDLLFLDIELVDMNGVQVGKHIRDRLQNDLMNIVYVSCRDSYYRELFEIRPMNFINKPVRKENIYECIDMALRLLGNVAYKFHYHINRSLCSIPLGEILYFAAMGRNVQMKTNKEEIIINIRLKNVFEELEKYAFCKTHKAYLVNLAYVVQIKNNVVIMGNGEEIPIGRKYKKDILDKF